MAYIEGASSSSASLSTNSWKYDVFLSFRGVDTRNNFTGHLYSALCRYGINTYKDDELERGEEISTALLKAIEDSKISIIVFSENYASSKWCLEELVKILDCKESKQQMVLPVFYNVDPSDVRNHGGSFGEALANMEKNNNWRASLTKAAKNLFGWHLSHEYKDNMEKVNKWRDALTEAGKLSGWHLLREHDESKIIQNIVEKISIQVRNRTYLDVAKYPVGMQPRIRDMDEHLDLGESNVRMVGVWGTGGIGKSTIAKAVYNSILHKFEGTNIEGASSSSASIGTNSGTYHVFLSFRGEDTRHNFTDHLYMNLCRNGINTFRDDDELKRGEDLSTGFPKAIEESKISIIVFSKNYASSKWCLDELVKILECKKSKQQMVRPIFYKVDPSDVRNQRGSFGDAFASFGCKYKDNMEKVHKWRAALSEAANLAGWTLLTEHESESEFIQKIVKEISIQVINRAYLDVAKYPVGIEPRIRDMDELLVEYNDVRMVGIWGTGGIGKTTIAKAVYNSIAHKFEGSCFLANVRKSSMPAGGLAELQGNLLSEILRGKKFEVTNVDKGVTVIKEKLRHRKVLVVLDDVSDKEQLDKLAGGCDWFGVGSRIIITTRDNKLLTAHHVNSRSIHKVKGLCYQEALELFSWNAFNGTEPPVDYVKLAEHAVRCAGGLPLVLRVLGSHLRGESQDKWQAVIDGLIQGRELQEIFKISYNALDDRVKEVFLDIACFFKGQQRNYVMGILEGCNLNPRYGIGVLRDKALIDIDSYDQIWMHDLLEEMGKNIVHQESPTEPGERSRLWFHEDIRHVLTENTGTKKITGIVVNLPKANDEICLNVKSFSEMKNLRIFINYNARLTGEVGYLSNQLRVLDIQLGDGFKLLTKLTSLNLSYSEFLTEIPDLSGVPNLKYLNASICKNLVGVDPSVGYLDKLELLDFGWCPKLTKFPPKVSLKSLKEFNIIHCKKFESFPKIENKIEST